MTTRLSRPVEATSFPSGDQAKWRTQFSCGLCHTTGSVALRVLPRAPRTAKTRPLAVGKHGAATYRNTTGRGTYVYVEIRPAHARAAEYTLRLRVARR